MLSQSRTHEDDIMHKPVLGIFSEHAEIDILEVMKVKYTAEQGLKNKSSCVDYYATLACFGNQSYFAVMKDNLRVLE